MREAAQREYEEDGGKQIAKLGDAFGHDLSLRPEHREHALSDDKATEYVNTGKHCGGNAEPDCPPTIAESSGKHRADDNNRADRVRDRHQR